MSVAEWEQHLAYRPLAASIVRPDALTASLSLPGYSRYIAPALSGMDWYPRVAI